MRFSVREFFSIHDNEKMLFSMLILHSWELLVLLNIYAFLISGNPWIIGISIGFAQHVVLDQIFNKPNRFTYFFFWRLKNKFCFQKCFRIK